MTNDTFRCYTRDDIREIVDERLRDVLHAAYLEGWCDGSAGMDRDEGWRESGAHAISRTLPTERGSDGGKL